MFVKSTTGQSSDQNDFDPYAMIADADAANRRAAASALSGDKSALGVLSERLCDETSPEVREAVVQALIGIGSAKVVDLFIECLRGDNATFRREAVFALQQMPKKAGKKIRKLMADADDDVRIMAVDVLQLLTVSDAAAWLRELLATETSPNVIGVAVDRLSEIGGPEDIPALEAAKQRLAHDAYVQFAADHAIARIKALEAEGPL